MSHNCPACGTACDCDQSGPFGCEHWCEGEEVNDDDGPYPLPGPPGEDTDDQEHDFTEEDVVT